MVMAMATKIQVSDGAEARKRKRKSKPTKLTKSKTMKKNIASDASHQKRSAAKLRNNKKMLKLFRKRTREYNSDDDDDDGNDVSAPGTRGPNEIPLEKEEVYSGDSSDGERPNDSDPTGEDKEIGGSEEEGEEGDEIQPGITKFAEGCRAFRTAFLKIMKKNVPVDLLGPVLSGHKKLIAEKLAEDEADHKVKGDAKKEKRLVAEKGHVKPANFLDTKEKFLVSVATKGVVKLFNAVNKAQNAQRGLNPSRSKDAKELGKRRKQAFLAELRKTSDSTSLNHSKGAKSSLSENNDEPGWAPLRDSYLLTNSKLKDWDKMPGPSASTVPDEIPMEDSSDDE